MIQWNDTHDEQVKAMRDTALLAASQRTDGIPGNPECEAIVAEIRRRGLVI